MNKITSVVVDRDNNKLIFKNKDGELIFNNVSSSSLIDNTNMARRPSIFFEQMINGIADMVNADYKFATTASTPSFSSSRTNRIVENRFSLPKELFEAVDFTNMGLIEEPKDYIPTIIKGEKYALKGVSCEGFEMPEKVYELVGVHDEFDGIKLNSLIVKQISGDQDKIFTLSKNDCEHIGIEYENGLQLFPKQLNWKRVKDIIPFDPSNLATTPLSDIDNTVRYVLLKINGFKDYSDGYVLTPSGKLIKEAQFEKTLRVTSNEPIVYSNPSGGNKGIRLQENMPLNAKVAYPKKLQFNHGNFISSEDEVYILIDLTMTVDLADSIDYKFGVPKEFLEGFNPNDHFTISWDELGAYTVEEYEAEKARKERERQERIAREEAERKRKVAEEEKRIKEQRRRTEEAISRMKAYHIELPKFPKMVDFNMENGLSSLNLYMDGLDLYFNSLDTSLTKLSKDLSQMSKEIGVNLDRAMSRSNMNSTLYDMFKL